MDNNNYITIITGLVVGVGLASAVGFRIFIPLFFMSISNYLGWLPLDFLGEKWTWIGSLPAVIGFGSGTLIETLGYYIPWVDNILDTIAVPSSAIAGTVMMATQLHAFDSTPFLYWALALIAGGGTATAISAVTASTRAASSGTTGGVANPAFSTLELSGAGILGGLSIGALSSPIVLSILFFSLLLVGYLMYLAFKKLKKLRNKLR